MVLNSFFFNLIERLTNALSSKKNVEANLDLLDI